MSNDNVIKLIQPGAFDDQLTEVLRTGARALRSMLERIMLDIMYEVPSREDVAEVTINRAVVEGKKLPLIRKKQDKDAA